MPSDTSSCQDTPKEGYSARPWVRNAHLHLSPFTSPRKRIRSRPEYHHSTRLFEPIRIALLREAIRYVFVTTQRKEGFTADQHTKMKAWALDALRRVKRESTSRANSTPNVFEAISPLYIQLQTYAISQNLLQSLLNYHRSTRLFSSFRLHPFVHYYDAWYRELHASLSAPTFCKGSNEFCATLWLV